MPTTIFHVEAAPNLAGIQGQVSMNTSSSTEVPNDENPPKISSPNVFSRVFSIRFQQICVISVSGDCTAVIR